MANRQPAAGPLGVLALLVVVNGLGEEAGWRGFLQPTLQRDRPIERAALTATLASAERKQSILDAISRPAERTLTWGEYRDIFMTEERIEAGEGLPDYKRVLDFQIRDHELPRTTTRKIKRHLVKWVENA